MMNTATLQNLVDELNASETASAVDIATSAAAETSAESSKRATAALRTARQGARDRLLRAIADEAGQLLNTVPFTNHE